MSNCQN